MRCSSRFQTGVDSVDEVDGEGRDVGGGKGRERSQLLFKGSSDVYSRMVCARRLRRREESA